ncbi:MAG: hypothetical protein DME01_02745 [Candidatus Rokuibacteriota bacterium]|nr:MAG: hypothetical protein DME01_02745 [Candidatus Rokubacteria bacterium]
MKSRRSLIVISGVLLLLLVGVAATLYALPTLARRVAVARLHAITKRPVTIDRVDVKLLSGRITIHGLRVAEPDGGTPFADCELLDARLNLLSLARGHIWVRELVLRKPTLRIVRLERRFNFSDLFEGAETTQKRLDVTVDRFALVDGTVAFEDRALPERRTWTSDDIQIEAHNVSTLRDDGTVVASSITAGAPNLVQIEQFRLYPIHLKATVTVKGLDLALARLYLPADAPVVLDRGRASSILNVTFDARDEVRADLNGELEDLVLVKPGEREPVTRIPKLTTRLTDLTFQHDQVRVGQLEVKGSANVRDPRAQQGARYQISTIRASIADVTWPITTPGRLDVLTAIPGGGTLAVSGMLRPPPAPSQLQLRLRDVDVGAWNRFLPITAKLSGRGEADLRINEPLSAGVPTRVNGSIAVNRLGVRDAREELIGARRVEATGLEVQWPARLGVKRVVVSGPRAIVERGKEGNFPLGALWDRPPAAPTSVPSSDASSSAAKAPRVDVEEIAVRNGVLSWRDETVKPRAALDVSQVDATVTGGGWPLRPVGVRLAVRPPGGGQVQVTGRVGVDPLSADLRVHAREAELAHYQPYVPTRAQFSGRADLDLAVVLPVLSEPQATVRGDAVFSRMDVRDGQRTVMRIGRASVAALDIDWPRSVKARELALRRPWILLERDQSGALPLGALLAPEQAAAAQTPDSAQTSTAPRPSANGSSQPTIPVVLSHLVIEEGGARVVDSGLTPPFAVDIADLASRIDGLSTAPGARAARIDMKARVGDGQLSFAGTIGPVTGPLRLDLQGELREFAVPRTNPYLLNGVAWEARNGSLTTNIQCRIDGDNLQAKADVLVSRLQLARAGGHDEAQARIGLPLGMIASLMKDRHGDIHLALPVGGRVRDPRFDFKELIWSTLRHVALNAITAPVSLIGRVKSTADSRIERIEIDPIRFEPSTSTPTPEGQEQLTRLVAFLDQMPETRLTASAVVSRRDLAAMKQPNLDAAISRAALEGRISPEAAAARLFQERFPGQPLPETPDAIRAALLEGETLPADAVSTLADKRLELVRTTIKKAGIDPARLLEDNRAEVAQADEPQVRLDLAESENPRSPGRRAPEFLRRLTSDASLGSRSSR